MKGANLHGTKLKCANLEDANLSGCNLSGSDLQRANLEGANLSKANLSSANLESCDLQRANLEGANLSKASMEGANLQSANLKDANLKGAILQRADLSNADRRRARLGGAQLGSAILKGALLPSSGVFTANTGVSVSENGRLVTTSSNDWKGVLTEDWIDTAGIAYAEFVLEVACDCMLGVTSLEAVPSSGRFYDKDSSSMYYCHDSKAWPGSRGWGAGAGRKQGDRVGLLVKQGSLYVYVNGRQLGPGPMVSGGLPPRVRIAADLCYNVKVRVMENVRWPE